MNARLRAFIGSAALTSAAVGSVVAQGVGTVTGRVMAATTGSLIAGADVSIEGGPATVTDSLGSFRLFSVAAGPQQLRILRIGYAEQTRRVAVVAGREVTVLVVMNALSVELPTLEVAGETAGQAEVRQLRQSPYQVTVIDGQRLAGRGLTLDEALQRTTGVQVRRSGGFGSASVFNVRGLEGQRVQIFVNGNAADIAGSSFSLDDIPLQLVERIEVYKGIVPARFGGDGLGAAINVVTIKPKSGYADFGYTFGSFGQHQASLTGKRFIGPRVEVGASVNVDRAENDYRMASPFLPGVVIRRDHDGFRRVVAGAVTRIHGLGLQEVEAEAAVIGVRREIQGIQTNVQHAETKSAVRVLVLDGETVGGAGGRLDLRIGLAGVFTSSGLVDTSSLRYSFGGASFPSPNGRGELGLLPSLSDNRTRLLRHRFAATWRFSAAHAANLTWVVDGSRYRPRDTLADRFAGRNVSDFPGDQLSLVVGGSHEWRPLGDRLVAISGGRGYAFRAQGTPSDLTNPTSDRPEAIRNEVGTVGASEALRFRFSPSVLGKASIELARRLPTSTELFGDGLLITAAPGLRPERSVNLNAGLQLDRTTRDGRRVQAEISAFRLDLRDMIRLQQGFAGLAGFLNFGQARITGVEAELRADVNPWLHLAVNGTYQDARDRLPLSPGTIVPNPTFGLRLPNMPWLFGGLHAEAHRDDLLGGGSRTRLFVEASGTASYYYAFEVSRLQERRIPGAVTFGVGVEQAWFGTGMTASAEIHNLTNVAVLNQFNLPLPGRAFRVKVRYTRIGNTHQ